MEYRNVTLETRNDADRTVEASLSSETPYLRPNGYEVLRHSTDAIDLSRTPLPLLTSHDSHQTPVGIIENIRIVGGKLRGLLRFGGSQRALDAWEDVKAGVLRSISVGYQILKTEPHGEDGYTVTRWMPYEASLVAVPADPTVGVGRSIERIVTMEHQDQNQESSTRSQRRNAARSESELREAVNEINALAAQFGIERRKVSDFIDQRGFDVDGFRALVTASLRDNGRLRPVESPELGMSAREIDRFSFVRAIRAMADPGARREAGFELECSRAFAQKIGKEPQGIWIPRDVLMQQRDLVVGTDSAGGYLRPTQHDAAGFIELLRKRCQVMNLGATSLTDLNGNLSIPSQTASSSAYWVAENNPVTESQAAFGQVPMSPKTVGGFTDYSRKMLLQGSPEIEQLVRNDLAATIAVEIDRVAIVGSGSGAEPKGILNTTGVGSVAIGDNGGAPTWDHMLALEETIALSNADTASMAYLTNPQVRRKLKGTTKVSGDAGAGFIWADVGGDGPGWGRVNGYRSATTGNVPSNLTKGIGTGLSAMILGNWADLLIGQWGGLDLLLDPYTGGTAGIHRIIALQDVDIAVRRTVSFAVISDIVTA